MKLSVHSLIKYRNAYAVMPRWAVKLVRGVMAIPYRGEGRFCSVCKRTSRKFRPYGDPPRMEAQCAHCGSLERHRLVSAFFEEHTDLYDGREKYMLHVAPEQCLEPNLNRRLGKGYLTADFADPRAMVKMDITDIQYPDESFDVIYCSHVLEHVPEDVKAMKELCRVLKSTGWAILLVPITASETFENPSITDPVERRRLFGQEDHVRCYGPDYLDRLKSAGFHVDVHTPERLASPDDITRFGFNSAAGEIYFCTKNQRLKPQLACDRSRGDSFWNNR